MHQVHTFNNKKNYTLCYYFIAFDNFSAYKIKDNNIMYVFNTFSIVPNTHHILIGILKAAWKIAWKCFRRIIALNGIQLLLLLLLYRLSHEKLLSRLAMVMRVDLDNIVIKTRSTIYILLYMYVGNIVICIIYILCIKKPSGLTKTTNRFFVSPTCEGPCRFFIVSQQRAFLIAKYTIKMTFSVVPLRLLLLHSALFRDFAQWSSAPFPFHLTTWA